MSREPKSFRWLKGSQELPGGDRVQTLVEGRRHTLIVASARYEDEGKYMFEAEDKRTSGKLIIKGNGVFGLGMMRIRPSAPSVCRKPFRVTMRRVEKPTTTRSCSKKGSF